MDVMRNQHLRREQSQVRTQLVEKSKSGDLRSNAAAAAQPGEKRRRRWDQAEETPTAPPKKRWDQDGAATPSEAPTPGRGGATPTASTRQWEETPGRPKEAGATPSVRQWSETPAYVSSGMTPGREALPGGGGHATPSARRNRWDETPRTDRGETPGHGGMSSWAETPRTDRGGASERGGVDLIQETPTPGASKRRSRWDETPLKAAGAATPSGATPSQLGTPTSARFTPAGELKVQEAAVLIF